MTEADWLAGTDPGPMLRSLNLRLRARARREGRTPDLERFRLFACACCRRIWHLLGTEDQEAVRLLERYTQSLDRKELLQARKRHRPAGNHAGNEVSRASRDHPADEPRLLTAWAKALATSAVWEATAKGPTHSANAYLSAARAVGSMQRASASNEHAEARSCNGPAVDWQIVSAEELAVQAGLLRDIFGSPFRPVVPDEAWRTPEVVKRAQPVYDSQDLNALPILADALEEAGGDHPDILAHLRGPGPHVRGCWALDLLLGRN